jgi:hypothetical protein
MFRLESFKFLPQAVRELDLKLSGGNNIPELSIQKDHSLDTQLFA